MIIGLLLLTAFATPGHHGTCIQTITPIKTRVEACHLAMQEATEAKQYYQYAQAYLELKQNKKALNAVNKAIYHGDTLDFFILKAQILARQQKFKASDQLIEQHLSLNKNKLKLLKAQAEIYLTHHKTTRAKSLFHQALLFLEHTPSPSHAIERSVIYIKLSTLSQKPNSKLALLNQAIKAWPSPLTYWERARFYAQQKRYAEYAQDLENLIQWDPLNYRYYHLRAQINRSRHNTSGVLNDLILAHHLIQDEADFQVNIHKINILTRITKEIDAISVRQGRCVRHQYLIQRTCQIKGTLCPKVRLGC